MNSQLLYNFIENPSKHTIAADELISISNEYPFFNTAHLLMLITLYKDDQKKFYKHLRHSSHLLVDRKYAFSKIHEYQPLLEPQEQQEIQQAIVEKPKQKNINTQQVKEQENISSQIEQDIQKNLVQSIIQVDLLNLEKPAQKAEQPENIEEPTAQQELQQSSDTSSFSAMLKKLDTRKTQTSASDQNSELKKERIKQQQEIIDKIIATKPEKIKVTSKEKFYTAENKAKESLLESEDLVSETLAKIYAAQGNIYKAIRSYEILSLKYPQKNTYFAAKIEELKQQLKK